MSDAQRYGTAAAALGAIGSNVFYARSPSAVANDDLLAQLIGTVAAPSNPVGSAIILIFTYL